MKNAPTNRIAKALLLLMVAWSVAVALSCAANCPKPTQDVAVCDPAAGPFSLQIDNPFFPLPVGRKLVLEGVEDGKPVRVEITVLDETEQVAGVTTRVVEERESEGGELVEVSRNFFAQAPDGSVCYFGEDVDDYEEGKVAGHGGAWRAGVGENRPGIMMPARPEAGVIHRQESAPGVAMDLAQVTETGSSVTTPAGTFEGALKTRDCEPKSGAADVKVYAPGIGLVVDGPVRLTSHE